MKLDPSVRKDEQLGALLGRSTAMQRVYAHLRKAANIDILILLQGESGTGKDLAAHAIHDMGLTFLSI